LLLTFNYEGRPPFLAAIFGGVSLTSLFYFIIFKGLKGADLGAVTEFIATTNVQTFIGVAFLIWTILVYLRLRFQVGYL